MTFWLASLYLPFPVGGLSALAGGTGPDANLVWYVPFAISCVLGFFGVLAFWADAGTNRALTPEQKRNWRRGLLWGWPVAAPLY